MGNNLEVCCFKGQKGDITEPNRKNGKNLAGEGIQQTCSRISKRDIYCKHTQTHTITKETQQHQKNRLVASKSMNLGDQVNSHKCQEHSPHQPHCRNYKQKQEGKFQQTLDKQVGQINTKQAQIISEEFDQLKDCITCGAAHHQQDVMNLTQQFQSKNTCHHQKFHSSSSCSNLDLDMCECRCKSENQNLQDREENSLFYCAEGQLEGASEIMRDYLDIAPRKSQPANLSDIKITKDSLPQNYQMHGERKRHGIFRFSFFGDNFSCHSYKSGSFGGVKGKRQHSNKGMRKIYDKKVQRNEGSDLNMKRGYYAVDEQPWHNRHRSQATTVAPLARAHSSNVLQITQYHNNNLENLTQDNQTDHVRNHNLTSRHSNNNNVAPQSRSNNPFLPILSRFLSSNIFQQNRENLNGIGVGTYNWSQNDNQQMQQRNQHSNASSSFINNQVNDIEQTQPDIRFGFGQGPQNPLYTKEPVIIWQRVDLDSLLTKTQPKS
eukprot:403371370